MMVASEGTRGGVVLPRVGPVVSFGWGQADDQVPGGLVSTPSSTGLSRPLRPVFAVRPGHAGDLMVSVGAGEGDPVRRFLHRAHDGRTRPLIVPVEAEQSTGWSLVDYRPAADGGIFLLELLRHGEAPKNG
jgi:hypothetical protein